MLCYSMYGDVMICYGMVWYAWMDACICIYIYMCIYGCLEMGYAHRIAIYFIGVSRIAIELGTLRITRSRLPKLRQCSGVQPLYEGAIYIWWFRGQLSMKTYENSVPKSSVSNLAHFEHAQ
jgi:hypothetical protein